MPFYELFCLARPGLARAARSDLMSSLGKKVLESGGIVTDVAAHGERRLAYEIRRPGVTFGEAFIWQLAFAAPASALPALRRSLALDDRVLRSALLARSAPVPKPPTTAAVAKAVRRKLSSGGGSGGGAGN